MIKFIKGYQKMTIKQLKGHWKPFRYELSDYDIIY